MRAPLFVLIALAIAGGTLATQWLEPAPGVRAWVLLGALGLLAPALVRSCVPRRVAFLCSVFLVACAQAPVGDRGEAPLDGAPGLIALRGEVSSQVWRAPDEPWRFPLRLASGAEVLVQSDALPAQPEPGDVWRVIGRLEMRRTLCNFGDDVPRALRPRLQTSISLAHREHASRGWLEPIGRPLRHLARERLVDHVGMERAGPPAALLLGVQAALPAETKARARRTGVAHLVVVSGLHLGLFLWLPARLLVASGCRRRTRAIALLALILAYGALTGAAVPVRRAILLWAAHTLAELLGRPNSTWSAWGFAATCELVIDPDLMDSLSFQLSYAAVAGILWVQRHASFAGVERLSALRCSIGATLATLPILHANFGAFSLHGIWLTPLLTPLVAGSLVLGFLGITCDLAWPTLGSTGLLELFEGAVAMVDGFPGTPLNATRSTVHVSCLWSLTGLLLMRSLWRRGALAGLVAIVVTFWNGPDANTNRRVFLLEVLDVGHGSCVLLGVPHEGFVLFDAGSRHDPHAAADALERRLRALGITHLDALLVSHQDADHHNLLERVQSMPDATFTVAPTSVEHLPGTRLSVRGGALVWSIGEARFRLHPTTLPDTASTNDRSFLLEVEVHGRRCLIFGDHEWPALAEHVEHLRPADLVLWPHHGRTEHGTRTLLERCRPRVVFASDDEDRRAERMPEIPWFTTGEEGALRWSVFADGSARVETAKGRSLEVAPSP